LSPKGADSAIEVAKPLATKPIIPEVDPSVSKEHQRQSAAAAGTPILTIAREIGEVIKVATKINAHKVQRLIETVVRKSESKS
tara:strand:- start:334 stop:582 length:249 start_codon:yes stop_codon:yes gene_type:complete